MMTIAASSKFHRLRSAFVQTLEEFVQFRGNDPMIARIYAMIVLSPDPMTQEQIAKRTGYSRSQISRYLANLEQRQMISREPTPGSRTMLYGGSARPFLDGFRQGIETAERFIKSKLEVMDHILSEWQNLPSRIKSTAESRKLREVITTFSAWFRSYVDLLADFNRRFNERLEEMEKDLLFARI
ncbi:MAG: MarR family transcriptional regulator [Candidatus Thorarchaeota archaeon]|nr:MAG: MarR family transcriptional regulator [Candidatus Thorarchaeota archaeon]